eukprot:gene30618-39888_t
MDYLQSTRKWKAIINLTLKAYIFFFDSVILRDDSAHEGCCVYPAIVGYLSRYAVTDTGNPEQFPETLPDEVDVEGGPTLIGVTEQNVDGCSSRCYPGKGRGYPNQVADTPTPNQINLNIPEYPFRRWYFYLSRTSGGSYYPDVCA